MELVEGCEYTTCLESVTLGEHVEIIKLRLRETMTCTRQVLVREIMGELQFRKVPYLFDLLMFNAQNSWIELAPVSLGPCGGVELDPALELLSVPPTQHPRNGQMIGRDVSVENSVVVSCRDVLRNHE